MPLSRLPTGVGYGAHVERDFSRDGCGLPARLRSFASASDSGNVLTRHFCPTCGGRVFLYSKARPGMIVMAAGAFDDSSWFEPEIVLFTKRRPHWDLTTDAVPNFEAGPPPPKSKPEAGLKAARGP